MTQTKKLYNLNCGVSALTCVRSPVCGTGGTEDFIFERALAIAASNTSTILSLELPSVVSSLGQTNWLDQ